MTNPIIKFFKKLLPVLTRTPMGYRRLLLCCEEGFIEELDRLAKSSHCSRAQVIDRAIGLYATALREVEQGKTIKFVENIESST